MTIGTRLFSFLFGKCVGRDEFGHRYYIDRRSAGTKRERRWVIYKGEAEASRVPPEWHAWLHHNRAAPPERTGSAYAWQKPHQPNLTGTDLAYRPPGHVLAGGQRAPQSGDYEAWSPQ